MRKARQNYIVFASLFVMGIIEALSGFVLWFALPQGGWQGGRLGGSAEFWSLSRHTWVDIHDWVAIAIMAVITIHLILHWKWIFYTTKKLFQTNKLMFKSTA